jgi:hypothetical protein
MKDVVQMAKVAKIYDGTAWVDLATSVPDLSNYQLKSEGGLTFIKKQTIGTAVSSVTVTDAFSATYENYKIVISGGVASGANYGYLKFDPTHTANYYYAAPAFTFAGAASGLAANNFSSYFYSWWMTTNLLNLNIEIQNPFLAKQSLLQSSLLTSNGAAAGAGVHAVATSYTNFTIGSVGSETMTGGTIYVYGYNKG